MRNTFTCLHLRTVLFLLLSNSAALIAQVPSPLWLKSYDFEGLPLALFAFDADNNGNAFWNGVHGDQITLGNITLTAPPNDWQMYTAKINGQGDFVWAKTVKPPSVGSCNISLMDRSACSTDASGNIIVGANYNCSQLTVEGGPVLTKECPGSECVEVFLVKYTPNGNVLWAKKIKGSNTGTHLDIRQIDTDIAGNIYVRGISDVSMDFGNGLSFQSLPDYASFLVKYKPDGTAEWARFVGGVGTSDADFDKIHASPAGNVYVTGAYSSSNGYDLGNGQILPPGGGDFLIRYTSTGTPQIVMGVMGQNTYFEGVSVNQQEDILVQIDFNGALTNLFGGAVLATSSGNATFLRRINANGQVAWSKVIEKGTQFPFDIDIRTADWNGNASILLSGVVESSTFMLDNLTLTNEGCSSSFVAGLNAATGNAVWSSNSEGSACSGDEITLVVVSAANDFHILSQYISGDMKWGNFSLPSVGDGEYAFYGRFTSPSVGTKAITAPGALQVDPNPAIDLIRIQWPVNFDASEVSFNLSDVFGKTHLISTVYTSLNIAEISLANLPHGLYTLTLHAGDGVWVARVVRI